MNDVHERVLQALFDFEQAWKRGEPFDIRDFAAAHADVEQALLPELVVLDSDCRWLYCREDFLPVQVYRGRFPEILGIPGVLLEMICIEVLNWPQADKQRYLENFSEVASEIDELFQIVPQLPDNQRAGLLDSMRRTRDATWRRTNVSARADGGETTELPKLAEGDTIRFTDACRIAGELSEGSHKWVFQAWQSSTGQPLAVKQLKRKSPDILNGFVSEGRAQANLDHQNIPPTMLLGPDSDAPTIVAEKLIHGTPWSDLLRSAGLSLERNLGILLTVSRAAEYAHRERGIVHRDIKPENVLIGRYGEVYLVDWGLAVRFGDDERHLRDEKVRHVDQEPIGVGAGTPAYMSPESALGFWDRCTPATDVFQLGAILYELLAQRPPFLGLTRTALLRAAFGRFPELPDDVPTELKSIANKAMARDPMERHPDAGCFADAIERYFEHRTAEEQFERAWTSLQQLRASFVVEETDRPESHTVVVALIAIADQFRQAGQLWCDSAQRTPRSVDAEANARTADVFSNVGVTRAREAECETRRELVTQAIGAGDLVLAEAQTVELRNLQDREAAGLAQQVFAARAKRRRHRLQRIGLAATACLLLVVASVFGVLRSRAESERAIAVANAAEDAAAARAAEAEAALANERSRQATEREERARVQPLINKAGFARRQRFQEAESVFVSRSLGGLLDGTERITSRVQLSEAIQASLVSRASSRRIMTQLAVFSDDGQFLATDELESGAIYIWDTQSWTVRAVLRGRFRPTSSASDPWRMDDLGQCVSVDGGHAIPKERGGQWGTVRAVAFNPDNDGELVSAGLDGTVRVWELDTKQVVRTYRPDSHDSKYAVMAMAIAPVKASGGARRVVIGRRDGKLVWLDLATLRAIAPPAVDGHKAHITAIRFHPNGSQLGSTGGDGTVRLWRDDGTPIANLPHPNQEDGADPIEMFDVAYSPDGKQLAAGGTDGRIHLWDPISHTRIRSLNGHPPTKYGTKSIRTLVWCGNGRLLSGASDGTIRLWDTDTGALLKVLEGHGENMFGNRVIWNLAVNPADNDQIASCAGDDTIRIWDLKLGKATYGLEGMLVVGAGFMTPLPTRSAYAPGNDTLITAGMSSDAYIRSWIGETLREQRTFKGLPMLPNESMTDRVNAVAIRPDGGEFVSGEPTGELILWNTETGEIIRTIKAHEPLPADAVPSVGLLPPMGVTSVAWSSDGEILVSLGHDGKIKVWNAANGELVAEWSNEDLQQMPEPPPRPDDLPSDRRQMMLTTPILTDQVLFSKDNRKLITAGRDKIVRIWDIHAKKIEQRLAHIEPVTAAALSWDGRQLASGTSNGQITVWDYESKTPIQQLRLKPLMVPRQFAGPAWFEPELKQHGEVVGGNWAPRVHSLAFSPDGRFLAATLGDGTLSVVHAISGAVMYRGAGHEPPPIGMVMVDCLFTKSGRLLTIGDDKTVRQWDLPAWDRGVSELPSPAPVRGGRHLAAGPNGQWAIAGSDCRLTRWKNTQSESSTAWRPVNDALQSVAYIPDSHEILLGTMCGRAIRFDCLKNEPVLTFAGPGRDRKFPQEAVKTCVAVSPDGMTAASSWKDGDIELWQIADGSYSRTLKGTGKEVMATAFHPRGTQLAVTDSDGNLRIWDLTRPDVEMPQFELVGPLEASGLDYSPKGDRLVQAGQVLNSRTIVIWNPESGRQIASLSGHLSVDIIPGARTVRVFDADFSPNGNWLAACFSDATMRVWKVSIDKADATRDAYEPFAVISTKRLDSLIGPQPNEDGQTVNAADLLVGTDPENTRKSTRTVVFSADSSQVATAGWDEPIRVYDMRVIEAEATLTPKQLRQKTERLTGLRLEGDYVVPIRQNHLVPLSD